MDRAEQSALLKSQFSRRVDLNEVPMKTLFKLLPYLVEYRTAQLKQRPQEVYAAKIEIEKILSTI
jgi:hypothetical protein